MRIHTVAVIGATGFVGSHLVNRLARDGYRIRALTRVREKHRDLLVVPTLDLLEVDVHDPRALTRALAGADAVINLAGILNEGGDVRSSFRQVHVTLPKTIVEACLQLGIRRYLHMSALNAASGAESQYLATKGEGESLVHAAGGDRLVVTSFRPSVIYGPRDSFFNRFARLLRLTPLVFPLACPEARFAPVYVGDVVEAFVRVLPVRAQGGCRHDICGPKVYTLRELVSYAGEVSGSRRRVIPLSDGLSRLQARVLERLPGKPFSMDNYLSTRIDSVCKGENGLVSLGIVPTPVESIVPSYLGSTRSLDRYQTYRALARRR